MTGAKAAADFFAQAVDNYESALKTGVKLQEDSLKWWSELASEPPEMKDWQQRAQAIFEELLPAARKNAEDSLKTFDTISQSSLEAIKKAFDENPMTGGKETEERIQQFWEETLKTLRKNTEAILESQAKALKSWAATCQAGNGQKSKATPPKA